MKLYIVRHGDYDTTDILQRLNQKGTQDIQRVADYLRDQGVRVREIWHSPKRRAAESAEIFQTALQCAVIKEKDSASPNAVPDAVMEDLAAQDEDILIVSHLPFIPRLLTEFMMQAEEESPRFPTAAVAVLERTGGQWRQIDFINPEFLS